MALTGEFFYRLGDFFGGAFGSNSRNAEKWFFKQRLQYQLNQGNVYINTAVPYKIYNTIPQFKIPVDKLAAMFSNGIWKYRKIGGDELDMPNDLKALLNNPNLLQDQNSFMKLYYKQLKVYGNQYLYKNQPSKLAIPKTIQCISPTYLRPVLTGKLFDQIDLSGVISRYDYEDGASVKPFATETILWSKIDDLDNPLIGISPLKGLEFPISNTELAYKYLNCISGEKGGIGILSTAPQKDSAGPIPLTPQEKKDIESTFRQENGIEENQKKVHITTTPTTWTPTSYPTGQLLLLEQIDANFLTILAQLGVNNNVFVSSTYDNLRNGLVMTHNDTVVPDADSAAQSWTKFLNVKEGYELFLDYSHLPYLQPDKVSEASTFGAVSSGLSGLVSSGIINPSMAQAMLTNEFGVKTA